MKTLKIGLVFDDSLDKTDGVQQYVLILGRWLAKQGHEVHYLVGETKRQDLPNLRSLSRNVRVKFNQNRMAIPLPASSRRISELLAREQFDVLHVQVPYSPVMAGKIIKSAGPNTAVVGTFHILPHSRLVTLANHALGLWARPTLKRFDAMLATSPPTAAFAKRTFKVEAMPVPLPLELDRFFAAKPFARYKSGHTIVFLGRLVERKGCQFLLRAVLRARNNKLWPQDTRVVICGLGPLETQLKAFVKKHKLEEMVSFEGFISEEDKPRYLASADAVVYPSTGGESFGIVLLEAMAASPGVVLAGDNPGYASVMAPRPAALFNPHDIDEFAAKIAQALTDKSVRKAANHWQKQYVTQFGADVVGRQIVEVYLQALHKRRS